MPPALRGRRSPGGQTLTWLGDGLARHGSPWEGAPAEAWGLGREPPSSRPKLQPRIRAPASGRTWEGRPVLALLRRAVLPVLSAAQELRAEGREVRT